MFIGTFLHKEKHHSLKKLQLNRNQKLSQRIALRQDWIIKRDSLVNNSKIDKQRIAEDGDYSRKIFPDVNLIMLLAFC